ncbi:MAG: hypothetical protein IT555_20850 [Acetobacteraceae bacterium]|nr:hypothetical protein [Acetobacteraceae bacterium]
MTADEFDHSINELADILHAAIHAGFLPPCPPAKATCMFKELPADA